MQELTSETLQVREMSKCTVWTLIGEEGHEEVTSRVEAKLVRPPNSCKTREMS